MKIRLQSLIFLTLPALFIASCHSTRSENRADEPGEAPKIEHVMGTTAILGEGSIWDYRKQVLYWIDIQKNTLYMYDPVNEASKSFDLGQNVGTIVPETDSTVIVALKDGVYRLELDSGDLSAIGHPESLKPEERFNDGKCDPQGRFWVGTMRIKGKTGDSHLYRMDHDGTFTEMLDSVSVSNGIIWSPDGKKMYYTDTPTREIMSFDFDGSNGSISNPKVSVSIADSLGSPDGMTIDADGNLWVAMWGGHAVCCFNPENGALLNRIEVPAKNVTSCAFGGPDLKVLYITTASTGMKEDEKEKYPEAGGLFRVIPGASGINANYFVPPAR
jgi:sugar lactone lactonase YvrE